MDGVADDDVLNAARALGSMRNVGTSSKEPAFDGVDLNASHDTRMRGYNSQTGEMRPDKSVEPVLMLRVGTYSVIEHHPALVTWSLFVREVHGIRTSDVLAARG